MIYGLFIQTTNLFERVFSTKKQSETHLFHLPFTTSDHQKFNGGCFTPFAFLFLFFIYCLLGVLVIYLYLFLVFKQWQQTKKKCVYCA